MNEATSGMTDEQLALLIQQGDKEKFGLLMERYEQKLVRYGRRFLSSKDNIDDVVQEVFIKTYQNMKSFDTDQKFSSWVYRIAHNTFVNAIRKTSRGPLYIFDFDTLISHPVYEDPSAAEREQKEMKAMLDKGLDLLSDNYKEILILYYLEDLSYKEIADILRIPTGTVGIRLKRAKEALKKAYKKLGLVYEQ
jgi:RNA polymerase sigma-70 factor (ECF subfamily)